MANAPLPGNSDRQRKSFQLPILMELLTHQGYEINIAPEQRKRNEEFQDYLDFVKAFYQIDEKVLDKTHPEGGYNIIERDIQFSFDQLEEDKYVIREKYRKWMISDKGTSIVQNELAWMAEQLFERFDGSSQKDENGREIHESLAYYLKRNVDPQNESLASLIRELAPNSFGPFVVSFFEFFRNIVSWRYESPTAGLYAIATPK